MAKKRRIANTLLPAGTKRIRVDGILAPDNVWNEWEVMAAVDPSRVIPAMRDYVWRMRAEGLFMPVPGTNDD